MKKNIRTTLMVINLVFVACAVLLTAHCLMTTDVKDGLIRSFLTLVTIVFSLFYILMDYKKSGAPYYRRFMISYTVLVFARAVQFSATYDNLLPVCLLIFPVALLPLLTEAKDLGRKATVLMGLIVLFCGIGYAVWCFVCAPYPRSTADIADLFDAFSNVAIASVMNIMIAAKYADKTARGRE